MKLCKTCKWAKELEVDGTKYYDCLHESNANKVNGERGIMPCVWIRGRGWPEYLLDGVCGAKGRYWEEK
jgi:hypothetical protein